MAGSPEGSGDGVDYSGEGLEGGEVGAEGGQEGVADGGDLLHDAAGEGEGWDPVGVGGEALEAEDDEMDQVS